MSDHAWRVCDDHAVLGFVEDDHGVFDAVLSGSPSFHAHFGSLDAAADYFAEYLDALELGTRP